MHGFNETHDLRTAIVPKLDYVLRPLGIKATRNSSWREYAISLKMHPERVERELHRMGVPQNNLASLKYLADTGRVSAGSWAWRYDEGNFETYRFFGDRQVHLTLFWVDGETHVFSHDELNPWRSPIRHENGVDGDIAEGVSKTRDMFAAAGVPYKVLSEPEEYISNAVGGD